MVAYSDRIAELFALAARQAAPQKKVLNVQPGTPLAIWESDSHVFFEFDVPGVANHDLELTVEKGVLQLCGRRPQPQHGETRIALGTRYGEFRSLVELPPGVDPTTLEAKMGDGVLLVTIAKQPEFQTKRVDVQSN